MPDSTYQGVAQEEVGIVKPTRTNSLNSVGEDVAEIVGDPDAAVCEIELVSRSPTATALATGANLLKCYMGSGILGLPYAFKQGGILYSVLVMLFLGVVATHWYVERSITALHESVRGRMGRARVRSEREIKRGCVSGINTLTPRH